MIREQSVVTRETTVCGGEQRVKNVYLSSSNVLEIQMSRYTQPKKAAHFVLRYEGELNLKISSIKNMETIDGKIFTNDLHERSGNPHK